MGQFNNSKALRILSQKAQELPEEHFSLLEEYGAPEVVKDYIAGMTDRYAQRIYKEKIAKTRQNRNR